MNITRRDEVVSRIVKTDQKLVDSIIRSINDELSKALDLPVSIEMPSTRPVIQAEVVRRIKESGWGVDINEKGYLLR